MFITIQLMSTPSCFFLSYFFGAIIIISSSFLYLNYTFTRCVVNMLLQVTYHSFIHKDFDLFCSFLRKETQNITH